jgi:hypothetical protein
LFVAALLFFLPLGLYSFSPAKGKPLTSVRTFVMLVVPSYILSLIAGGLLIRLLLIKVLHVA